MCGIVYASRKEQSYRTEIPDIVLGQYMNQRNRGSYGFGLIDLSKKVEIVKEPSEREILARLLATESNALCFHHRYPTSSPNNMVGCHPYEETIDGKTYYTIHNGIISNPEEVLSSYPDHNLQSGHNYDGYAHKMNDSEALAVDIAHVIAGKKDKISCDGSYAFVTIIAEKGTVSEVVFGTNGVNPLKYQATKDGLFIASELPFGESVEAMKLYRCNVFGEGMKVESFQEVESKYPISKYVGKVPSVIDEKYLFNVNLTDFSADVDFFGDDELAEISSELAQINNTVEKRIKKLSDRKTLSRRQTRKLSRARAISANIERCFEIIECIYADRYKDYGDDMNPEELNGFQINTVH